MNILNGDVSSDSDSSDNDLYPLDESDIVPGMTAEEAQEEAAANEEFENDDSTDSSESEYGSDDDEEVLIDDDESSDGPSTEKEAMLNKLQSMLSKLKSGNPAVFEADKNDSEECTANKRMRFQKLSKSANLER